MSENDGDEKPAPPSRGKRIVRIVRHVDLGVHIFLVALLLLRITLRDLFAATEPLFLVPAIVIAIPALLTAPFLAGGKIARLALHPLLLITLLWTLVVEQPRLVPFVVSSHDANGARDITLTSWNVMSYNLGEENVIAGFQDGDPDIVCLLEGTYRGRPPGFLRRAVPEGFEWASTLQMAIGSRYPVLSQSEYGTDSRLRVFRATLDVQGTELSVYLVDLPSPPRVDTDDMFDELRTILDEAAEPEERG